MAARPLRSPAPPTSPNRSNAGSRQSQRSSIDTDSVSDTASNYVPPQLQVSKRPGYGHTLPAFVSHKNASTTSINQVRPSAQYMPADFHRKPSSFAPSPQIGHRRQHSQGYFEPSMPSASLASQNNAGLTPSQIAAQTAVQHLHVSGQHMRRRSSTVPHPEQEEKNRRNSYGSVSSDGQSLSPVLDTQPQYRNGLMGTNNATTAAQAVWKAPPPAEEKEKKGFRSKFRPKHIGIIGNKDKVDKPLLSPNKPTSGLAKVYNASTTSLADTLSSVNSSMYNLQNNSVSTIIPARDDEKKKHTGLRQKLKLKDKDDFNLNLSSANSNSQPVDINNPKSLYNFAPSSPNHSSFAKSVSGLDLRARAHRKEKKEERSQLEQVYSRESEGSEWPSNSSLTGSLTNSTDAFTPYSKELRETLGVFGLNNMTPDDAWEFLKARLLVVFEGEHVNIAVEDLNRLVTIHVQRCVLKRDPSIIIGDLENLLHTGFSSLNHTLRGVREETLVPHLVDMWMQVFGTVLPFLQAVFLPLDQEFKGRGSVLKTPQAAAEFWGALPSPESIGRLSSSPSSVPDNEATDIVAGEELEIRRILLTSFRDHVILPRFDVLKATFSRLSLESINATLAHFESSGRFRGDDTGRDSYDRPVASSSSDPRISSSYSSQTSTLLGGATPGSRSRATSNLSAGSAQDVAFQSFSSPPAAQANSTSSAQITETVARMLQCLSVLSSVQSNDEAQTKLEELTKELKLNWLGRGRTGRNRKGFVGSRVRPIRSIASTIRGIERVNSDLRSREGSPTPTPTRQGTVSRQEGRAEHG
ncbi:hypothetical protein LTR05_003212 [Lithohypha guttulata]|uniref:HbrB n=1 Tax=Lithohypha guttulata TaxID=1690604 RepID=A0AAN7T5B6_9EURO|nr:hypothetical protein LTR05_003212 [Lithohypha guttulata]